MSYPTPSDKRGARLSSLPLTLLQHYVAGQALTSTFLFKFLQGFGGEKLEEKRNDVELAAACP